MQVTGIALLLQRFNFHNSGWQCRTLDSARRSGLEYAEADGIEDYCKKRSQAGVKRPFAEKEAVAWLDAKKGEDTGYPRRERPELPKNRKPLISRMSDVARTATPKMPGLRPRSLLRRHHQQKNPPLPKRRRLKDRLHHDRRRWL